MFLNWEYVEVAHIINLLQQLQQFYIDPNRWCDWPLASDDKGIALSPLDPKATKFCLQGACDYLCAQEYVQPLADCVNCATREYLDELSGSDLIHGKCDYETEMELIAMAISELTKESK